MRKSNLTFHLRMGIGAIVAGIFIVLFQLVIYFLFFCLFMIFLVIIIDTFFLLSTVGGAIYIPTKPERVETMIRLAKIKPGQKAVDIGSGDGRIVLALAKAGAHATGYEVNPLLVIRSWLTLRRFGVQRSTRVLLRNFWLCNFKEYDVVTLFGISYIMRDLEKKLLRELRPGAKVISNAFPFPHWKPIAKENEIYVYQKD
jgi:precorrin-6B methylase 2